MFPLVIFQFCYPSFISIVALVLFIYRFLFAILYIYSYLHFTRFCCFLLRLPSFLCPPSFHSLHSISFPSQPPIFPTLSFLYTYFHIFSPSLTASHLSFTFIPLYLPPYGPSFLHSLPSFLPPHSFTVRPSFTSTPSTVITFSPPLPTISFNKFLSLASLQVIFFQSCSDRVVTWLSLFLFSLPLLSVPL